MRRKCKIITLLFVIAIFICITGFSNSNRTTVAWEVAYDYILTSKHYPRISARAQALKPYVIESTKSDALCVCLNSIDELYVGCLPITEAYNLGDIVEITYTDNSSMKVICADFKNTNKDIELWCTGSNITDAHNFPNAGKTISAIKIVGHSDIFDEL